MKEEDMGEEITRRKFIKLSATTGLLVLGAGSLSLGCAKDSGSSTSSANQESSTVTVTDLSNCEVEIPAHAQHIAALVGSAFNRLLFLGGANKTACYMTHGDSGWYNVVYPDLPDYDIKAIASDSARNPDMEEMLSMGVDLVYYWNDLEDVVAKFNQQNIPVVRSGVTNALNYSTGQEWADVMDQEIHLYSATLDDKAKARADEWVAYLRQTIDFVGTRTSALKASEIPSVYYIRSATSGLECFGMKSYPLICVKIAGGRLVTEDLDTTAKNGWTTVTMEQVVAWNPDVIFTGWIDSTSYITDNEQWSTISAVKNNKVFISPSTYANGWCYDPDVPLEIYYLAKKLHPDLFTDVDLVALVQDFYKRFRDYDLSAEDANRLLNHKEPNE